jgi:hypothetical protein
MGSFLECNVRCNDKLDGYSGIEIRIGSLETTYRRDWDERIGIDFLLHNRANIGSVLSALSTKSKLKKKELKLTI